MEKYNPEKIEKKWQKRWEENPNLYTAKDDSDKPKKYILDMFPYPSAAGLHVGHVESYTATDIISRYYRYNGFNVLHPQGWDAFGLPAENYAIKTGIHPNKVTHDNIKNFTQQIKSLGLSYDWSREIDTSSPEYYKWTQWFFLFLYKNGLAYKKKAKVNWCDSCQTVLANEQAEDGICERCKNAVVQKDLEQWFFRITDFIEKNGQTTGLLDGLDAVDWPESIKAAQRNWIGRSEGAEFDFEVNGSKDKVKVFTTRLDTVFGVTYVVVAPEHDLIWKLKDRIENWNEIEQYISDAKNKTDLERMETKEKTGVEVRGIKIINPFNQETVSLFVADYVLGHYGTGAVMAVPAHDERDFEFARKYNLPIKQSIAPLILTEKKDHPRDNKKTTKRKTVVVILKHWDKNEIYCLDWEKFGWKSFLIGGVENGESDEEAAIREMKEESGYQNIKSIRKIGGEVHSNFFAAHKDENRYAETVCYFIELADGKFIKPKEEDVENHKGEWVKINEISSYVNLNTHKWFCEVFEKGDKSTTDDGVVIDSGEYSGLSSEEARRKMTEWLEKEGAGRKVVNYKLRDWLVSRQRYWGAPIPIIYCEKCGEVPVSEDQLPVMLPDDVDFKPTGESPLVHSKSFHDVLCPICGEKARRESDTMDTFVCSSWYYLRYADPKNSSEFSDKEKINKWLPVDVYVGGAEHAVLHLLYARFFTKALHKFGKVDFNEPFLKLRNQGMILAEDGRKMSKSLGNVVNPDQVVAEFGADTLRLFEMFMGPLEDTKAWQTQGIIGLTRFLEKIWNLQLKISDQVLVDKKLESFLHKTIKKVTEDIENFRFNTAISQMMILTNEMEKYEKISSDNYRILLILLSPFAPHVAEEIWEKLGNKESIFLQSWPQHDEGLTRDSEIELIIQVNGKLRDRLVVSPDISEEDVKKMVLENEKVKKYIGENEIKKTIFVPGKLINIVI